jgi:hypothetical protein
LSSQQLNRKKKTKEVYKTHSLEAHESDVFLDVAKVTINEHKKKSDAICYSSPNRVVSKFVGIMRGWR